MIGYGAWLDYESSEHPILVISADAVVLRKGNGLSYPACLSVPLNRGVEGRLLFQRGNWLQIELVGREVGWIPEAAALVQR